MCRRGERKACNRHCSVDFDFLALLMLFDVTFDVTLRDDSSFSKLSFSLFLVTCSIKANF